MPESELPASTLADCVQQIQENQQCIAETEQLLQDLLLRSTSLANAQKVLEQHTVLAALTSAGHTFGCHSGRPVAALLLHRCCLHWRTFETPEGGPLLEQLLALIAGQAADDQEQQAGRSERQAVDVDEALSPGAARLAYWLATSSTLLAMVTKLVPPPSTAGRTSHPGNATAGSTHPAHLPPTPLSKLGAEMSQFQKKVAGSWRAGWARSLMSKMGSGSSSGSGSTMTAKPDSHEQQQHAGVHEAGYASEEGVHASTPIERVGSGASAASEQQQQQSPVLPVHVFRQQLALLTLRLYGLLRDHFKKQLASLLPACVQATSGASPGSDTTSPAVSPLVSPRQDQQGLGTSQLQGQLSTISNGSTGQAVAAAGATATLQHWAELVALLSRGLRMLQDQGVPRIMCKCLMKQVLAFVDVQMFNQLLLRPECCSASNTHTMAEGLKFLDAWLAAQADNEETSYLVALQADLSHVRQALLFLVHSDKGSLSLQDIVHMCPALSLQQLYRLCTTFWDDTPQPAPASPPRAAHQLQQQQAAAPGVSAAAGLPQSGQLAQQEHGQQGQQHAEAAAGVSGAAGLPQHEPLAQQEHDQLAYSEPFGSMRHEGSAGDSRAMEQEEGSAWAGHGAAAAASGGATAAAPAAGSAAAGTHGEGMEDVAAAAVSAGGQNLEMYVAAPASSGMVSGEVLEELKGQPQVLSNGGLIVTFLLDEEQEPVIAAPRGSAAAASCAIAYELLALIDDTLDVAGGRGHAAGEDAGRGHLYAGMPVPSQLLRGGTPKEPFLFLEKDVCY